MSLGTSSIFSLKMRTIWMANPSKTRTKCCATAARKWKHVRSRRSKRQSGNSWDLHGLLVKPLAGIPVSVARRGRQQSFSGLSASKELSPSAALAPDGTRSFWRTLAIHLKKGNHIAPFTLHLCSCLDRRVFDLWTGENCGDLRHHKSYPGKWAESRDHTGSARSGGYR